MKLFTIGDSVSQGFMSAAAARTDLTYSTLIAGSMGLEPKSEYRYPGWALDGLPLNLERIFRRLVELYGYDIRGAEWLTVLQNVNRVIDEVEDYYERGPGAADEPYRDPDGDGGGVEYFHNVAISGFDVADSWLVTPAHCKEMIANAPGGRDSFLLPNASFYRTALKVLNPSLDSRYDDHSQLKWLEEHATDPNEGVENLIVWLGANNALGTIVGLQVNPTPNDPRQRPHLLSHEAREGWTLWHPDDFEAEYAEFLDRVDNAMRQNTNPDWKVFIGTVPPVTIAPLAKGVGPTYNITRKNSTTGEKETSVYYEYYVYFLFDEGLVRRNDGLHLEMKEVIQIDDFIREYNTAIRELVKAKNADHQRERYHIVDMFQMFQDIALKRNAGQPKYDFPKYFDSIYPKVDTRYYHADPDGRLRRGGLSSLDGVHPSAIGHGLLAHEFLKEMKRAGVVDDAQLDWGAIFESDRLYSEPIIIMQELYQHTWLAEKLLSLIRTFRRSRVPESDHAPVVAESESPVERVARVTDYEDTPQMPAAQEERFSTMEEMTIDVGYLIENWASIRDVLAPSADLFPQPQDPDRDRVLAEHSLLSSRREYWEVFVLSMRYSEETGANPNDILTNIPFEQIWNRDVPWDDVPVLRFWNESGVEVESVLPAAYAVRLVLAGESLETRPRNTLDLQRCWKRFDGGNPDPETKKAIRKCLTGR